MNTKSAWQHTGRLAIAGFILVAALASSAARAAPRCVIAEEFGATWCGPCAYSGPLLGALLDAHEAAGRFTFIQIHIYDAYTYTWNAERAAFYGGVPAIPSSFFDGVLNILGANPPPWDGYTPLYNQRANVPTDVTISLGGSLLAGATYRVQCLICLEPTGTPKSPKVHLVQVLDHWPAFPTYHRNGFKQAMMPAPVVSLTPGNCQLVTWDVTLDAESMAAQNDIKIIAFAQTNNASWPAEVHQSKVMFWPFPPLGDVDVTPPTPNPMTWSIPPQPASTSSIVMQATEATDADSPPVEYYFDYTGGAPGGMDSGWQASRDFVAAGLPTPNAGYNYVVRARDSANPPNQTTNSSTVLGSTAIQTPAGVSFSSVTDTSMTVQINGAFTNLTLAQSGIYLEMTPAAGSGANTWAQNTTRNITGLTPGTVYTFRAKARNFQGWETPYTNPTNQATTGGACTLLGDVNGDAAVNAGDIAGYLRVKLGVPQGGDLAACANFGTGDVMQDTAAFVALLLAS